MTPGQGEELDQGGRLPEAPLVMPDGPGAHRDSKATEQLNAHRLRYLARGWFWSRHSFRPRNRSGSVLALRGIPFRVSVAHFPTTPYRALIGRPRSSAASTFRCGFTDQDGDYLTDSREHG